MPPRLNRSSDTNVSKSDGLPIDIRNRLEGHANNFISIMDDVIEAQLSLQRALKTIADQKGHIAALSAEVQRQKDGRIRMEAEHKKQTEQLHAMNAWLMGAPKLDQSGGRIGR